MNKPEPLQARGYADLHEHLDTLRKEGLLLTIDRAVDKDSELHPLVRWQYVGGIDEHGTQRFQLFQGRRHHRVDRVAEAKCSAHHTNTCAAQPVGRQELRVIGVGFAATFSACLIFFINSGERAQQNRRIADGAAQRTGGILAM